jgi:hypothetical protein
MGARAVSHGGSLARISTRNAPKAVHERFEQWGVGCACSISTAQSPNMRVGCLVPMLMMHPIYALF